MRNAGLVATSSGLDAGDHLSWVYEDESSWRDAATIFLHDGAQRGDRLLYVAEQTPDGLVDDLAALASRDVMLASGQLRVGAVADVYGPVASFDPMAQVDAFDQEVGAAVRAGFRGLRIAGDTTTLAATPGDAHRFISYEMAVDALSASRPLSKICGYDRRQVGDAISELCCVHPLRQVDEPAAAFGLYRDRDLWWLVGEVDLCDVAGLRAALDTATDRSSGDLCIDASGINFIDVDGTRALVELAGRLAPIRSVVLRNCSDQLIHMFELAWGPVSGLEVNRS